MSPKSICALMAWGAAACLAQRAEHVVIVGIDGLGGAWVKQAEAPQMAELMKTGAWSLRARGVMPTVSSPNWMSLLSGAGPEFHGVHSNEWERDNYKIAPACRGPEGIFPGLFGAVRRQRPFAKLAAIHDWRGFGRLVERYSVNLAANHKGSAATAEAAVEYLKLHKPLLLFVHFDDVDHAGHDNGWGSAEYLRAIAEVDGLIGKLRASAPAGKTVFAVVADHGGTEKKHGNDTTQELEVPFILNGPGVRGGEMPGPVRSIDLAPTVLRLMGLQPDSCWEGRALLP